MANKGISQAVIGRLPRYYRYLGDLQKQGVERISSQELSWIMNVTASQIRQDFNNFGGFGQQGYGYNIAYLREEIGKILGLNHQHNMILIGTRGFLFKAAFDSNPDLIGTTIGGIEIHDVTELESYLRENSIDIAVLTLPREAALKVTGILARSNIRAIWNFAHLDLDVPDTITVENVHLSDSLMKLSYNIHRGEQE